MQSKVAEPVSGTLGWRQPNVPDTGSATFDCIVEPVP